MRALPLTLNGMLDRNALPAPEGEACARRRYEARYGEVERTRAALSCGVEQVGRQDPLFRVGRSFAARAKFIARLRRFDCQLRSVRASSPEF
jgi:hypothetical protein